MSSAWQPGELSGNYPGLPHPLPQTACASRKLLSHISELEAGGPPYSSISGHVGDVCMVRGLKWPIPEQYIMPGLTSVKHREDQETQARGCLGTLHRLPAGEAARSKAQGRSPSSLSISTTPTGEIPPAFLSRAQPPHACHISVHLLLLEVNKGLPLDWRLYFLLFFPFVLSFACPRGR